MTFNDLAHAIRALHVACGENCRHGLADMTDEEVVVEYATPNGAAGSVATLTDIRSVVSNCASLVDFDQYLILRMFSYDMTEEERNLLDTRLTNLMADTMHEFLMHRDALNLTPAIHSRVLKRLLSNVKQYLVNVLREREEVNG